MKDIKILDNLVNKAPEGLDLTDWVFTMSKYEFRALGCCKSYKGFKVMIFNSCPPGQVYLSPTPIM